jgi:hypothetical protein
MLEARGDLEEGLRLGERQGRRAQDVLERG